MSGLAMQVVQRSKIKQRTAFDGDGSQQAGLACAMTVLGGMFAAAALGSGALSALWICFTMVMLAVGVGSPIQPSWAQAMQENAE